MHSTSADCESFLSKKLNNEPEKLGSSLAWIVTETWVWVPSDIGLVVGYVISVLVINEKFRVGP